MEEKKGGDRSRGARDRGREYMMMEGVVTNGGGNGYHGGGDAPPLSAAAYTPPPASPPQPPIDQNCIFHSLAASTSEIQLSQEHTVSATKRILLHQALLGSDGGHHGPQAATERERIDKRLEEELENCRRVQAVRMNDVYSSFLPQHHQAQALLLPHLEMLWPGGCLLQARPRLNATTTPALDGGGNGGDNGSSGGDCWLALSSGLTNSDMPTRFRLERFRIRRGVGSGKDERLSAGMEGGDDKTGGEIFASNGMAVYACDRGSFSSAVSLRPRLELDSRWAGYGYEIGIMTRGKQTWATHCLSFMVPLPFSSGPTVAARAHTSETASCTRVTCVRATRRPL
jgi:hypothetical protein